MCGEAFFPPPPAPVSVRSRTSASRRSTCASSASRPMNDVSWAGRLLATRSSDCSGGNALGRSRWEIWKICSVRVRSRSRQLPEVDECRLVRQGVVDEFCGRPGGDRLTAMRNGAQAGRADDRGACVATAVCLRFAVVKSHPYPDRRRSRPWLPGQSKLGLDGGCDGSGCPAERGDDTVALPLLAGPEPAVGNDGCRQDLLVAGHGRCGSGGVCLPRPSRRFTSVSRNVTVPEGLSRHAVSLSHSMEGNIPRTADPLSARRPARFATSGTG